MEMCAKRPSLKRTAKLQKLLCFGGVVLACFALSLPGMLNIVEANAARFAKSENGNTGCVYHLPAGSDTLACDALTASRHH